MSANDLPTSFTFTGQREAPETGLMYYVARFYDPEIGHFIQADTIIPSSGSPTGWNRYAYANYNPINYNDPSGHLALLAIAAIVVGVGLIAGAIDAAIQQHNTGEVDLVQTATVAAVATGVAALGAGALVATGVVTVTASAGAVAATTTATTGVTAAASNGLEDELQAASQVGNMSQELVQKLAQVSTQNPGSSNVSIGLWDYAPSYTTFGANNGFTYLDMPNNLYGIIKNSATLDFWQVNAQFLDDAIDAGKTFILSTPYQEIVTQFTSSSAFREINYLFGAGYKYIIESGVDKLILPK